MLKSKLCDLLNKEKIINARDIDTIATGKRLGHPVRSLKNQFSRDFFKKECDPAYTDAALDELGAGALRRAAKEGDMKTGCILAGQVAGLVNKVQPAAEIVREVCAEAKVLLRGASGWVK